MSDAPRSANVVWQQGIQREQRWAALGHGGATVWMTGLPGIRQVDGGGRRGGASARGRAATPTCSTATTCATGSTATSGSRPTTAPRTCAAPPRSSALLADAGVVVLVALVSPYRADREAARAVHDRRGLPFLEVWVATSLEECERRDPKGLYARARAGELNGLTGVDDPYEPPENARRGRPGRRGD